LEISKYFFWTGFTGLMGLELIRIVFVDGKHGQAKLDRGTQISTVAGEKIAKKVKNLKKGQRRTEIRFQMSEVRKQRVRLRRVAHALR
jgi:hypothetical protein